MPPNESRSLHQISGRSGLGLSLAVTTVALWSVLPIGLKIALGGLDAMTLTWIRFVAATTILGLLLRSRGAMPRLQRLGREDWPLMLVAAAGLSANYALYVLGLHHTNAATSQVVIQLAPMLFTLGGIFVFKESFAFTQWLGLAVLIAGLGLFSSDQIAHMASGLDRYYVGLAFIVGAAVSWAAYGLAQKQLLGRLGSAQIMLCLYAFGALVFTPLSAPSTLLEITPIQFAAVAFCTANMLVSYASFSEALAHVEASRVSAVLTIVPLGTLAAAHGLSAAAPAVFPPEPVSDLGVVGALLVVSGSMMAALGRRQPKAAAPAST